MRQYHARAGRQYRRAPAAAARRTAQTTRPTANTRNISAAGNAAFHRAHDRQHLSAHAEDSTLEARMAAYELAFRMQSAAPDAVDLSKETPATKQLHGIGDPLSDDFGHKCLLARRLVERCVRFVQLYSGTQTGDDWDNAHTDLVGSHTKMCAKTDKPIAALLADLKARGLLASTLVAASLAVRRSRRARSGATITPYGLTTWMAGGGIKGGQSHR